MSDIPRFVAYAAAFEKAFETDDWSGLEPFFSEDAVYEIGLPLLGASRCTGRDEILAWFPDVLDRFDRRFASRTLELIEGPKEENGAVWIKGSARYCADGIPDFVLILEETVRFKEGVIVHLEDRYCDEMAATTARFVADYAAIIGVDLNSDLPFAASASD